MANPDDERGRVPEIKMSSIVFLDFEATGLLGPAQHPRITELCLLAVHRDDLYMGTSFPRVVNKLTLCLNPKKPIQMMSSQITGLYNDNLERQRDFSDDTVSLINGFLSHLEQPVCLVAHYGNGYDFPLLKAELNRIKQSLRNNIYCVDSLEVFRTLDSLEQVKNYLANESAQSPFTSIPVQFLSDYSTPQKNRNVSPPASLKRKSPEPEPATDSSTKTEQTNTTTSNVKRTLIFEQTEKTLESEEMPGKAERDSETGCKATSSNSDAFKAELMEEFEFSDDLDDELIAAADMAEKSIQDNRSDALSSKTNKILNGQHNQCHNQKSGNDVMSGSGYSVRVDSKMNPSYKNCSDKNTSDESCRPYITTNISVRSKLSTAINTDPEKTSPSGFDTTCNANMGTNSSKNKDLTPSPSSTHNKSKDCDSPSSVISSPCLLTTAVTCSPSPSVPARANTSNLTYSGTSSPQKSNSPSTSGTSSGYTPVTKKSFKLVEVYRRLYGEAPPLSHTAEDDCVTLLKCVQRTKDFSSMIDKHAELFSNIKPGY